jgi:RHS repeat-associated protein
VLCNRVPQNYKFTGKERDSESGLDYFGARHYTSALGRFMVPDWAAAPIDVPYANFGNPQSLNLYSYVKNNPTTMGDPDGHDPGSGILLNQLENRSYMQGQQKGAEIGAMLVAGGAALAALWETAPVLIRGAIGLGLANAPQAQKTASVLADLAAPPGTPSFSVAGTAEAFGFKSIDAAAGGLVGGELQNGARAAVNFSKAGSELSVGISMVKGPAGTLKQIESGAVSAAKATNSNSVKITATMVKDSMGRLLRKNGFVQELKDGKVTGRWIKTIKLV